jgi:phosphoribosylformylglycinamidine synthase I
MKFGVVVFPGSNCDHDAWYALAEILHQPVEFLWHQSESVNGFDAILLPGGFAYGDYLRTGAIARFSPVMRAVEKFARAGGPVLGICNGFQILCEAGLLPGALQRNAGMRFVCKQVHVRVETTETPFTASAQAGQVLQIPIAHGDGNFYCDEAMLGDLERNGQIVFRYTTAEGREDAAANPNGSLANVAGVCNAQRNVVGLMPHPERAVETPLGSADGLVILRSLIESLSRRAVVSA